MDGLSLADRLLAVASSLRAGNVPFAFGGAIALAYALEEPRATRDLDLNVFVPTSEADLVLAALPIGVAHTEEDRAVLVRDQQVRLWWNTTPIDLFFDAAAFHQQVATRVRTVPFADSRIPVLDPSDLAVFKVLFDRTKDWLDLTMMAEADTLEVEVVAERLTALLGEDPRIERLRRIRG